MSEYYTDLAEQANAMLVPGVAVATEPAVGFTAKTASLETSLRVDFDVVMQAAVDHGKDPDNLRSLGVSFVTPAAGQGRGGILLDEPAILGDKVHYPIIQLTISESVPPNIKRLNNTFRHEFRHVMQEGEGTLLYDSQILQGAVALGGAALVWFGGKWGYDALTRGDVLAAGGNALQILGGAALMVNPRLPLWFLSPVELDASWYARTHSSFAPISVA